MHVVSSQGCGGSTLSCRLVDGVGSCGDKVLIKSAIFLRPPETYRLDRSDRARYIHNSVTWFLFSFRKQSIILSHFINNFNFSLIRRHSRLLRLPPHHASVDYLPCDVWSLHG